jgi:uncharacterized protein
MSLEKKIQEKRREILNIAERYGAYNIRIFGSVARQKARENSDLDLLIELEPQRTLLDYIGLKLALENLLDCRVDLAETETLPETIREQVISEAIPL